MIRRTDWLIGTQVLAAIGVVWMLLLGFDLVQNFATDASGAGKGDYTIGTVALSLAWTLPRRAYALYVHAAVVGAILGLGSLAATSEITAMRAGGLSKGRIAGSALLAIGVVLILVVAVGETLAPYGDNRAEQIEAGAKEKDLIGTGKNGLWKREGNQLIHALHGRVGKAGVELSDLRIYTFDDAGELTTITSAKRAAQVDGVWHLYELARQSFGKEQIVSTTAADEVWPVILEQRLLQVSIVKADNVAIRDLALNIAYLERNQMNADEQRAAFWQRIFYPLEVLLLAACMLPFAFGALRSGGFGLRLMIGVVVAILWQFFAKALITFAGVYHVDHRLAHGLPCVFLLIVAVSYFRRRA